MAIMMMRAIRETNSYICLRHGYNFSVLNQSDLGLLFSVEFKYRSYKYAYRTANPNKKKCNHLLKRLSLSGYFIPPPLPFLRISQGPGLIRCFPKMGMDRRLGSQVKNWVLMALQYRAIIAPSPPPFPAFLFFLSHPSPL